MTGESSMKAIISEFSQETDSFASVITERSAFTSWRAPGSKKELDGIYDALVAEGIDCSFGPMYRAQASGPVRHSVVLEYLSDLFGDIDSAGGFDVVGLAMHGATQSTEEDDVCGYVVEELKKKYPAVKIAVTCDLHGNITKRLFEGADAISGFQTYPHRDTYETGLRAGRTLARILKGKETHQVLVKVPMIAPASGYTTDSGPLGELYRRAHKYVATGKLLEFSIFQMQPWLDVREGASTVLTVSENASVAKECALSLAQELSGLGDFMQPKLDSLEDVVLKSNQARPFKPVVCSDFSDSPNAGATGDNILILKYFLEHGQDIPAAFIVNDGPAAKKAFELGVNGEGQFRIGGTIDEHNHDFVEINARVKSLHDGIFRPSGPVLRGVNLSIGQTAVLSCGSFDILVCENMAITGDLELYRHFGIDPMFYKFVLVKANTSFKISYNEVSDTFMAVDSGGSATANLKSLPWKRLPRDFFYPFTEIKDKYKASDWLIVKS